jgi:translation initiation factor RLI1
VRVRASLAGLSEKQTKRIFSFLDSEQRIITAKVIKRFILHAKKTAFVIEHDFIMATYLADRVIVFEGTPAIAATATPYVPLSLYDA